jgi:DNA mismatch endonuclease (patch repair protein)
MEKIGANRSRDCKDQDELIAKGWRVLTIWECALKGKHRRAVDEIVEEMVRWIREGKPASNRLVISHL